MAAYRTAYRLFTGSHLPPLYIGIEHMRMNNLTLAQHFIEQSSKICDTDPLVFNEMGMIQYQLKNYDQAREYFELALQHLPRKDSELVSSCLETNSQEYTSHFIETDFSSVNAQLAEPIMFNLGNTYRKLKQYPKALAYYKKCLGVQPKNASIYSAIGLTYHLQQYAGGNNLHTAIEYYHKALAIQSDHSFTATMLSKALVQISNQSMEYLLQQADETMSESDNNKSSVMDENSRLNKALH